MITIYVYCGAISRMDDVCDLQYGHTGLHSRRDKWGGIVEWGSDHSYPCDCGDCHNSQPAIAEKEDDWRW